MKKSPLYYKSGGQPGAGSPIPLWSTIVKKVVPPIIKNWKKIVAGEAGFYGLEKIFESSFETEEEKKKSDKRYYDASQSGGTPKW